MGEVIGPISFSDLQERFQSGQIERSNLVQNALDQKWQTAESFPVLFEVQQQGHGSEGSYESKPEKQALPPREVPLQNSLHPSTNSSEDFGMPHYAQYVEYTKSNNWKAICKLNNVRFDSFGTKKEFKVLPNYIEDDEVVFAVASGIMKQTETSNAFDWGNNTWLVVFTSERFLFLDHALLTSSVDTQSIRHDRVQAVSASQGWILGKITVDLGARTVVVDNCNKEAVSAMASVANKWLSVLQKKKEKSSTPVSSRGGNSLVDEIKKLAELHAMGALTDEEFKDAKAKLLANM